ncbi:MAG: gluconolactonase [Ferruginibacter sp.]|nr:gluconolactonase [Ferruginibacter sp.]
MKKFFLIITGITAICGVCNCQGLPPIYDQASINLLSSKVLLSYPKNTFLENLVKGDDDNLYVTNFPEGTVLKISPAGQKEVYAKIEGKIAGIAKYDKGQFLITGWDKEGKPSVFLINQQKEAGTLVHIEGGMFPNGIIPLTKDQFLIADSYAGCIWLFDYPTKKVSVWVKDPLLGRSSPESQNPAANGLKIYKNMLYVSNTNKQIMVKIPIENNVPGKPALFLDKVGIDDFTFDPQGNIYAATHVYNCVIRITPGKNIDIVAGLKEGVAGCTAILYSKHKSGKSFLYITTNGGMSIPPPSGIEEGKIITLEIK